MLYVVEFYLCQEWTTCANAKHHGSLLLGEKMHHGVCSFSNSRTKLDKCIFNWPPPVA